MNSPVATTASTDAPAGTGTPSDFRLWDAAAQPGVKRVRRLVKRATGFDVLLSDRNARALCDDMYAGDPVAEHFVDDVFFGQTGARKGRQMLDKALDEGIDAVDDVPESMAELFREFEEVPDWVDADLVEEGAKVWRRWGTTFFSVAGAGTLEMYTESAVATPLSLAGGYAGDNALRRFLESARFWIDVSEPGALLRPGTAGRGTAMRVRVMHVSVRRRVAEHDEWHTERFGLPISQAYMMLTLIGGSVAPALAMWPLGYQTSPREMRALLHFQRYLGYLLGVRPSFYPNDIGECVQTLVAVALGRTYTSGRHGAELIESFPKAFEPRPEHTGLQRVRAQLNYQMICGYCAFLMDPRTRKRYDMPPAFPGVLLLALRWPLVAGGEIARRAVPSFAAWQERRSCRNRERWHEMQMAGREAAFDASSGLRR